MNGYDKHESRPSWVPEDPHPSRGGVDPGWIRDHQEAELVRRIGGELNNWLEREASMSNVGMARDYLAKGWGYLTDARGAIQYALKLAGTAPEFRDLVQPLYGLQRELDAIERAHVGLLTANEAERMRQGRAA